MVLNIDPAVLTPRCCCAGVCDGTLVFGCADGTPRRREGDELVVLLRCVSTPSALHFVAASRLLLSVEPSADHAAAARLYVGWERPRDVAAVALALPPTPGADRWLSRAVDATAPLAVELPCGAPVRCAAACGARAELAVAAGGSVHVFSARVARRSLVVERLASLNLAMVPRALDLHAGVLAVASTAELLVLAIERRVDAADDDGDATTAEDDGDGADGDAATGATEEAVEEAAASAPAPTEVAAPAEAEPTAGVVSYFEVPVDEEDAGDIVVTLKRRLAAAAAKAAAAAEAERAAAARAEAARLAAEDDDEERFPRVVPVDELGGEEEGDGAWMPLGPPDAAALVDDSLLVAPVGWMGGDDDDGSDDGAAEIAPLVGCEGGGDGAPETLHGAEAARGGHVGALGHVITLPAQPSTLLPTIPMHEPWAPELPGPTVPTRKQQVALLAPPPPPAASGGSDGWSTAGGAPPADAAAPSAAAVAEVWCGGGARAALRWVHHERVDSCFGAHTVTLLSQRDGDDDVVDGTGDDDGDGERGRRRRRGDAAGAACGSVRRAADRAPARWRRRRRRGPRDATRALCALAGGRTVHRLPRAAIAGRTALVVRARRAALAAPPRRSARAPHRRRGGGGRGARPGERQRRRAGRRRVGGRRGLRRRRRRGAPQPLAPMLLQSTPLAEAATPASPLAAERRARRCRAASRCCHSPADGRSSLRSPRRPTPAPPRCWRKVARRFARCGSRALARWRRRCCGRPTSR